MNARRDAEEQRAGAIPTRSKQPCDEHARREADHAIGMFGAEQEERIDRAVLCRAREKDQRRGADRESTCAQAYTNTGALET